MAEGLDDVLKMLDDAQPSKFTDKVRDKTAKHFKQSIQNHAVFTKGYSTGATKDSAHAYVDGDGDIIGGVGTEYAPILEYGSPRQAAQPFMGPASNETYEFMNRELSKEWGG